MIYFTFINSIISVYNCRTYNHNPSTKLLNIKKVKNVKLLKEDDAMTENNQHKHQYLRIFKIKTISLK